MKNGESDDVYGGRTVVGAATYSAVAAWMDSRYKADRLDREEGCRDRLVTSRLDDLREYGRTVISRFDTRSGEAEWLVVDGTLAGAE